MTASKLLQAALDAKKQLDAQDKLKATLLGSCFPAQLAMIKDPSRLKAALCTRQSGKSFGIGLYLLTEALTHNGCTCLYIALTQQSAKHIMYKDVFKVLNTKYRLGLIFNETTLTITCPNGSVIYLMGMDSSEKEQEKSLGQKYKLVVVDEAGSFRRDLQEILESTIMPACVFHKGTIVMIGTPRSNTTTYFAEVTNTDKHSDWSVHRWTGYDNPYIAEAWARDIEKAKAANPEVIDTAYFKQNFLGQWVVDDDDRVYRYKSSANAVQNEGALYVKIGMGTWFYTLGVDLGWNDPSAFVLMAYNEFDPNIYVVEAYKREHMTADDVAIRIQDYQRRFSNLSMIVVDPASKQLIETIRNKYNIPFIAAQKMGKVENIELINSDLAMKRIYVLERQCEPLVDELKTLVWDDQAKKLKESDTCANHCCDAFLYGIRETRHYHASELPKKLDPGTEHWVDEHVQKLVRAHKRQDLTEFWEK